MKKTMKNTLTTFFSLLLLSTVSNVSAADAEAGKAKAASCAACHGAEGISAADMFPNLAGQKAGYLVCSLKAYRDGTRVNVMMSGMAKGLSDEDIDNLAAHYSALKTQ